MKEPSLPSYLSERNKRKPPLGPIALHPYLLLQGVGVKGEFPYNRNRGAKLFMISSQRHSYHSVDPSPWPISGSLGALATTVGGVMYMHSFTGGATLLGLGLIFIPYTMFA